VEAHINAWDCLGGIAICTSAGARVNDYLSDNALLSGGRIVAGSPDVFDQLVAVLGDVS
jgi:myo-inositol-1(or 4)-monophosphatase